MTAEMGELIVHLEAETAVLRTQLDALDPGSFSLPTPAEGWTILDQVTHLAFFDEVATATLEDPDRFAAHVASAATLGDRYVDDVALRHRALAPELALEWFDAARGGLRTALLRATPSGRVAWFGPSMSVASLLTSRIMETWAHGQDVFDALGVPHPVTDALGDVAFLCARTRQNSYEVRGRTAPTVAVSVELDAPTGATWRFGDGEVAIRGDAIEFCLVATQRRHVDATSLRWSSAEAREWLELAQAFAGPPGAGRRVAAK